MSHEPLKFEINVDESCGLVMTHDSCISNGRVIHSFKSLISDKLSHKNSLRQTKKGVRYISSLKVLNIFK